MQLCLVCTACVCVRVSASLCVCACLCVSACVTYINSSLALPPANGPKKSRRRTRCNGNKKKSFHNYLSVIFEKERKKSPGKLKKNVKTRECKENFARCYLSRFVVCYLILFAKAAAAQMGCIAERRIELWLWSLSKHLSSISPTST